MGICLEISTADGVGASPCVYDEMVFVGSSDTMMYAVDLRTGRKIWHFETNGSIYSSPTARFEHVFGSDDGYLYALNVKHGRSAWKTNAFSAVRSSPYVDEERVFLAQKAATSTALNFRLVKRNGKHKPVGLSRHPHIR